MKGRASPGSGCSGLRGNAKSLHTEGNADDEGIPPYLELLVLCKQGLLHEVEDLLGEDSSLPMGALTATDPDGYTPHLVAARFGWHHALSVMIRNKAPLRAALARSGNNALHLAATHGHVRALQVLLDSGQMQPDMRNHHQDTALLFAVAAGHVGAASVLLRAGADAGACNMTGLTPCMAAAAGGHPLALQLLLRQGNAALLLTTRDKHCNGPLHYASSAACIECAKVLLAAGCDVYERNIAGRSPLDEAQRSASAGKSAECFQLLQQHGAELESRAQAAAWALLPAPQRSLTAAKQGKLDSCTALAEAASASAQASAAPSPQLRERSDAAASSNRPDEMAERQDGIVEYECAAQCVGASQQHAAADATPGSDSTTLTGLGQAASGRSTGAGTCSQGEAATDVEGWQLASTRARARSYRNALAGASAAAGGASHITSITHDVQRHAYRSNPHSKRPAMPCGHACQAVVPDPTETKDGPDLLSPADGLGCLDMSASVRMATNHDALQNAECTTAATTGHAQAQRREPIALHDWHGLDDRVPGVGRHPDDATNTCLPGLRAALPEAVVSRAQAERAALGQRAVPLAAPSPPPKLVHDASCNTDASGQQDGRASPGFGWSGTTWVDAALEVIATDCPVAAALDVLPKHILGLDLECLSVSQLEALEVLHRAALGRVADARIALATAQFAAGEAEREQLRREVAQLAARLSGGDGD